MIRVLADRHHAGLFHSLQLMFGRIGAVVQTPIGREWWDEGIWNFGREAYRDDRLVQQFLNPDPFIGPITFDPEFPETPIHGVTLEQAREVPWDIVLATLQDNQHGFARFAREVGATYALAVGNTGQMIDWGLDPAVINSSEMPVLGRGVNVGQEFDSVGLFGWQSITRPTRIVSLANCMTSMPCYPLLRHAIAWAPDLEFRIHGIDGPDGNLKPIGAIAKAITSAGWGWHDKTHGDGFGHVIHYMAAIGRPLIGHASHYAGKRAEGLWVDGVTCIDLDRHPIGEALDMVREISADPHRHNDMSVAIRRAFDAECDWDRDARAVADLLGLGVAA